MLTLPSIGYNLEQKSLTMLKSQQISTHLKEQLNVGAQLSRRYAELLSSKKYTDCTFHICESTVKCHKLILGTASPVFEAMFYGPLSGEHDKHQAIEIDDISAEVFEVLIDYIYSGSVDYDNLTLESNIELYYAAEKYLLNELIADCLLAITHKLRFTNILPALELSVCMNLTRLLDVCMSFFMRCCVHNAQYMQYLKQNYVHVSKECVKAIISACKEPHKLLLWYIYEWTQQECQDLGLQQCDTALIIDELQLETSDRGWQLMQAYKPESPVVQPQQFQLAERCYYKACRPYTIAADAHVWRVRLKLAHFLKLMGLVMNSRLTPNFANSWQQHVPLEYNESLRIDLAEVQPAGVGDADENGIHDPTPIWSHLVQKQVTKYNCDLHIDWQEGIVLAPDVVYELKLSWTPSAYGAEYPCSLQSSLVDGIKFIDGDTFSGSLVKGVRYMNLI